MSKSAWFIALILQCIFVAGTVGSIGDRSQIYNHCLVRCLSNNCNDGGEFKESPPLSLKLLLWTCKEDCSYICTWETVEFFTSHGLKIPQFHGKWPFIRMIGCQEPASVLFSIMNFVSHWIMYHRFKEKVKSLCPMFYVWSFFSIICLNGWFWSTVFHARDTPFTEMMDYSCAFTMVLSLLYCILLRLMYKSKKAFAVITCGYVSVLYTHLSHLWSGQINYGYNMKFNILLGFLTFVITMTWWYWNHHRLPHVYLIGWFIIATVLVTLLEVADFAPIFWTFDAHSLWHASTAPLAVLLYRFMIMDCIYLKRHHDKSILDVEYHVH